VGFLIQVSQKTSEAGGKSLGYQLKSEILEEKTV